MEIPFSPFERSFELETPSYLEFIDNTWEVIPFNEPVEPMGEAIAKATHEVYDQCDLPAPTGDVQDRGPRTGQEGPDTGRDSGTVAKPKRYVVFGHCTKRH